MGNEEERIMIDGLPVLRRKGKKRNRKQKPEPIKLEPLSKPVGDAINIQKGEGTVQTLAEYQYQQERNEDVAEVRRDNARKRQSIYPASHRAKFPPYKEKNSKPVIWPKSRIREEKGLKMAKFSSLEENIGYIIAISGEPLTTKQIGEKLDEIGVKTKTPISNVVSSFWKYMEASESGLIKREKINPKHRTMAYSMVDESIHPEDIAREVKEGKEKWKLIRKEAKKTIESLPDRKKEEITESEEEKLAIELQNELVEIPQKDKRFHLVKSTDVASSILDLVNKGLKVDVTGGIDINIKIKIEK